MSELKAFDSERIYWAVEQVEIKAGDIDDLHLDDTLFYLKSEADKVIEELKADYKEACDRLHTANLIKDEKLDELRRQKYKRCLNNAWWCFREEFYAEDCHCERWVDWAIKWWKRWLELADKFKE